MDNEENSDSRWPKIRVKREERIVWCKPCRRVLVLKLLGRNISYKVLNQRLQDLWGLEYGSQLINMEGDFFIARFFSRDEYLLILKGGRGSLPELPIEFFNDNLLLRIGNEIGRAVRVDQTTITQTGRFAQICVQVNPNKPLIPMVATGSGRLSIEYSTSGTSNEPEDAPFPSQKVLKTHNKNEIDNKVVWGDAVGNKVDPTPNDSLKQKSSRFPHYGVASRDCNSKSTNSNRDMYEWLEIREPGKWPRKNFGGLAISTKVRPGPIFKHPGTRRDQPEKKPKDRRPLREIQGAQIHSSPSNKNLGRRYLGMDIRKEYIGLSSQLNVIRGR
ncbi:hypothetical protein M9H77_09320 [Catharanthus roseus]|uniref:Uncharacterized protein n=1 Tax=Catharanthus roseus TaxID=4058 RepID=A0ACC0C0E4_CATRO|nr:hypothetical protein M9H77_09320 [Catharanthus roseus]